MSECGHQVYGSVCQVVDPMYLKVEQMVGMTLPLIVNKYVGLLVAIAFFPVLAITIPFLVVACTIGLPIFLPIVIVSAMLFIFNGLIILSLLVSVSFFYVRIMGLVLICHMRQIVGHITSGTLTSHRALCRGPYKG